MRHLNLSQSGVAKLRVRSFGSVHLYLHIQTEETANHAVSMASFYGSF